MQSSHAPGPCRNPVSSGSADTVGEYRPSSSIREIPNSQHQVINGRNVMWALFCRSALGLSALGFSALGFSALGFSAALVLVTSAFAQEAPRSWVASPDVYKVIGESAQYRVIVATWKPGQKDNLHSHTAGTSISLTDCDISNHPTGVAPINNLARKAGDALPLAAIASHSTENIGNADCQIIFIERK
jgi:hypothetical protein